MIPPRRPYVMTSPSGGSSASASGNNNALVVDTMISMVKMRIIAKW